MQVYAVHPCIVVHSILTDIVFVELSARGELPRSSMIAPRYSATSCGNTESRAVLLSSAAKLLRPVILTGKSSKVVEEDGGISITRERGRAHALSNASDGLARDHGLGPPDVYLSTTRRRRLYAAISTGQNVDKTHVEECRGS